MAAVFAKRCEKKPTGNTHLVALQAGSNTWRAMNTRLKLISESPHGTQQIGAKSESSLGCRCIWIATIPFQGPGLENRKDTGDVHEVDDPVAKPTAVQLRPSFLGKLSCSWASSQCVQTSLPQPLPASDVLLLSAVVEI